MSSASIRQFLISDSDEIFRVSNTKFGRMLEGSFEEKAKMFSGQRIRAAEIVVQIENRKPVQVIRVIYYYLHFNENGVLDYDRFIEDGTILWEAGTPDFFENKDNGNLINAQKEFAKRRRYYTIRWEPNMELERNILDASIDEFKYKRL